MLIAEEFVLLRLRTDGRPAGADRRQRARTHNRARRIRRLLMVAVAITALAACGEDRDALDVGGEPDRPSVGVPDGEPAYSGEVTNVSPFEPVTEDCVDPGEVGPDDPASSDDPPICTDLSVAPLGRVLVEEIPGEQTGDKISLRIDRDTPLFREVDGGDLEPLGFDDLVEGDIVDAWIDGPVADSYPQQGTPVAVLVRS